MHFYTKLNLTNIMLGVWHAVISYASSSHAPFSSYFICRHHRSNRICHKSSSATHNIWKGGLTEPHRWETKPNGDKTVVHNADTSALGEDKRTSKKARRRSNLQTCLLTSHRP